MPNLPDEIIIKKNKELQDWLYVIATFLIIGGVIALFGNGEGGGFLAALFGFTLAYLASKIKTKRKFKGGVWEYQ